MEININLLPQSSTYKEKRSIYLIPVLGLTTVLATASFLTYSYFDAKNTIQSTNETIAGQTTVRDELLSEYQSKTSGVTEYNFVEKYKSMDQVFSSIYANPIDLKEKIYKLLPEKAKVVSYTYSNNGELAMTVNSFSKGDSALFLNRLLNADFVGKAELLSITADDEELTYEANYEIKLNTLVGADE